MIASLWNGISGISTYSKAINVGSNDIANVNTVAHKKSQIKFEDLMYENSTGKGVTVQSVDKVFTQGTVNPTSVATDVAIEGDGFFTVVDPIDNEIYYTRAGNFKVGLNGNLLTSDNLQVQGVVSNPIKIVSSAGIDKFDENVSEFLIAKNIFTNDSAISINANISDYEKTAGITGTSGQNYKTRDSLLSDIEANIADYKSKLDIYASSPDAVSKASSSQITVVNYNTLKNNLQIENNFISIEVNGNKIVQNFDTDADTTMNLFTDKISALTNLDASVDASGILTIKSTIPGKEIKFTNPAINELSPVISNTVNAEIGTGLALFESSQKALQTAIEKAGGKFLQMENSISTANEQNLSLANINLKLNNLGISTSQFSQIEITDGNIYLKDGENKFLVGKLSTVRFSDNNGLKAIGNNNYSKTANSGDARYSGDTTSIVSSSLELSNSDLSENLTDMLVLQKAFEANSKVITTSDEFLKTAINLKK